MGVVTVTPSPVPGCPLPPIFSPLLSRGGSFLGHWDQSSRLESWKQSWILRPKEVTFSFVLKKKLKYNPHTLKFTF